MTQKQALKIMQAGHNVFLTGPPGTGKTYLLNSFIDWLKKHDKKVAITASTGIAASQISGTTFHSWSSIGLKNRLTPGEKKILLNSEKVVKKYKQTDILIIDEISMLDNVRLDLVNELAKEIRGNQLPFGGIQLILVGDFFQLPPIEKSNPGVGFVFKSKTWYEANFKICYLEEQHRQLENDRLLSFLINFRNNQLSEEDLLMLSERVNNEDYKNKIYTELYSHNIDVDQINKRHLDLIDQELKIFHADVFGPSLEVNKLLKNILVPPELLLKVGCQVMMVVNNFKAGYFNGSLGRVVDFELGKPVVQLRNGRRIIVEKFSWKTFNEQDQTIAEVRQYPLRLAWAITIHKSQGMSLDAALIDLSKSFSPGMGYVALSRVRSIDGLYLKGYNDQALLLDEEVCRLDFSLRYFSKSLDDNQKDLYIEELDDIYSHDDKIDQELLSLLFDWRTLKAREQADVLTDFPDSVMEIIATLKPSNIDQLLTLPGLNRKKIKNYGSDILSIIKNFSVLKETSF